MPFLSVNPNVLLSPVADGYIAYHTTANRLHELNPTAALLVELCDGSRDADAVLTIASPLLPPNSEAAVRGWIDQAVASGVLVEGNEAIVDGEVRELPADQLSELACQLRSEGKVQAAYLCQDRATQLLPDNNAYWRELGELAHIVGKRPEAREAYEHYMQFCPDDAEVRHLLTSLRDDEAPARVPDECIKQLYERFSAFYDSNMCDELGYSGPEHLNSVVGEALGERRGLSVLDLGCGTGLAGLTLKDRASRLIGIDLSAEMISRAEERGVYDHLQVAEITEFLRSVTETFDLIIACDALIYFGDLSQVIAPAVKRLNAGGVIGFSVEAASKPPWSLTDSGRYVHHADHVNEVAQAHGLEATYREEFLRMEYGKEVTALYVTMTSGDPSDS
ncbi:methyltransferase domain-containing protein [Aporhodopirellula aestuarii]|uniref:Methyltransferase domain-containing protein n=1 Tax=Aporhodopirellula aestuarii TaxID=2950107 RepID=A0ABT0UD04_9BACT|nr:methyltransferase domain-containing protein [Aporhodopirellula aestuarii]MCM2374645.1 methyltransferase domain-containing protein [Aporhodopirellula aestuarii]